MKLEQPFAQVVGLVAAPVAGLVADQVVGPAADPVVGQAAAPAVDLAAGPVVRQAAGRVVRRVAADLLRDPIRPKSARGFEHAVLHFHSGVRKTVGPPFAERPFAAPPVAERPVAERPVAEPPVAAPPVAEALVAEPLVAPVLPAVCPASRLVSSPRWRSSQSPLRPLCLLELHCHRFRRLFPVPVPLVHFSRQRSVEQIQQL